MISDMSDLEVETRAVYNGDLLNPETLRAHLDTQHVKGEPESSGYGEGIWKAARLWGHGGTISAFSTEMWYIAEADATIVISLNRSDETMDSHSSDVLAAVLTSLFPEALKSL